MNLNFEAFCLSKAILGATDLSNNLVTLEWARERSEKMTKFLFPLGTAISQVFKQLGESCPFGLKYKVSDKPQKWKNKITI